MPDPTHVFDPKDQRGSRQLDNEHGTTSTVEGALCKVCGCLQDDPQHS